MTSLGEPPVNVASRPTVAGLVPAVVVLGVTVSAGVTAADATARERQHRGRGREPYEGAP